MWLAAVAVGAEESTDGFDFDRDVAAVLVRNCLTCHNTSEPNGGLDLTALDHLTEGGDSGPAIVPGAPDESYLLERIADGEMPPEDKGERLGAAAIEGIRTWIAAGAPWPAGRVLSAFDFSTERRAGYDWWSLQPPARPAVPDVNPSTWARNPIDQFILAKLGEAGLAPSPEADRATYLRRAKLDLLGLPPTPEEIDAFVADESPDAYERLIDRLLASPHFGERWGRHWLDVVRFGETNGYETNTPRQNAWPYRDYVIRAFNEDVPFAQFIREQLAGDQLGADIATGFLVGGTHDTVGNATIEGQLQQRMDDLNDMVSTTATAFLGLTAGCARCHDHKFDPISQRDYYAMQAVFAGVQHGEREIEPPDRQQRQRRRVLIEQQLAEVERRLTEFEPLAAVDVPSGDDRPLRPAVSALYNVDRFAPIEARFVRFTIAATNRFEPCLDELEILTAEEVPRNVALAPAGARADASGSFAGNPIHQLAHVNDGRYGNLWSWISSEVGAGWVVIELAEPTVIDRVVWSRDREGAFSDRLATEYRIEVALEPDAWHVVASSDDRRPYEDAQSSETAAVTEHLDEEQLARYRRLTEQRESLERALAELSIQRIYAGTFKPPEPTHVLYRGDPLAPRDEVAPAGIAAVAPALVLSAEASEPQRRLALADWIASEQNPLTARVMVNRIWQYHFGRGLVDTPSDLGFNGARPSHPELLDYLAVEFMENGWRAKPIHRLIMLSATYRQASAPRDDALRVDADARLLWRFPPRRLEAEPLRDSILMVSGKLDPRMGGPGYHVFESNDNYVRVYVPKSEFGPAEWRRMVYQFKPRIEQDGTFGAFDCPDASSIMPKRNVSTTALQALNLLNSPFMVQQAEFLAERVEAEAGDGVEEQVERAFRLAFGRRPSDGESSAASMLVDNHGLAALCRALLNASEFIYIP